MNDFLSTIVCGTCGQPNEGTVCSACNNVTEFEVVNLTPHAITVGGVTYPPSGKVARLAVQHSNVTADTGLPITAKYVSEPIDLPDLARNTVLIVSGMVFDAMPYRQDILAPATGHPDVIRNDKGHIVSVPAFLAHD